MVVLAGKAQGRAFGYTRLAVIALILLLSLFIGSDAVLNVKPPLDLGPERIHQICR